MSTKRILVGSNEIVSQTSYKADCTGLAGKYSINVVFSGAADYELGNRTLRLHPENFIFLNSDTNYSSKIDSATQVKSLSVFFDPCFVQDFEYSRRSESVLLDNPFDYKYENPVFVESIYPLQASLKENLLNIETLLNSNTTNQMLLQDCLNDCLLNYYSIYNTEVVSRTASLKFLSHVTKSEILRRLCIAKDYIISNYNKNIRLDDIARTACLSINHLLRTFKQAYQQSPHQFLTTFRLQQAKYYLRNTDYPVSEIVDMVGFECPSSFIRLFRSSFNITPGQYR
ncbi:helix-turn-helix transcriptional regulator [Pedobacter steynii]